jgi:hypothetical protein
VDGGPRLAATSESEIVLGVELIHSLVASERGRFLGQQLRDLILEVEGRVDATLTLRSGDKAFVGTFGIGTLIERK